jgi:hypothetical protein
VERKLKKSLNSLTKHKHPLNTESTRDAKNIAVSKERLGESLKVRFFLYLHQNDLPAVYRPNETSAIYILFACSTMWRCRIYCCYMSLVVMNINVRNQPFVKRYGTLMQYATLCCNKAAAQCLGAFTKLRKATISFIVAVRMAVNPQGKTRLSLERTFMKCHI